MTLVPLIAWLTVMVFDTGGQLTFKAAANHGGGEGMAHWRAMARKPWLWLGLLSFVVEFVAWLDAALFEIALTVPHGAPAQAGHAARDCAGAPCAGHGTPATTASPSQAGGESGGDR